MSSVNRTDRGILMNNITQNQQEIAALYGRLGGIIGKIHALQEDERLLIDETRLYEIRWCITSLSTQADFLSRRIKRLAEIDTHPDFCTSDDEKENYQINETP